MEGFHSGLGPWLAAQTAGLREFLTGYLPSTATGAVGLLAGFTRR